MTPVIVVPNDNLYPRFSSFHGHAFTFLLQSGAIQMGCVTAAYESVETGKNKSKRTEPFDTENHPSVFITQGKLRINPRNKGGKQYGFYRSTHGIWHGTCHE